MNPVLGADVVVGSISWETPANLPDLTKLASLARSMPTHRRAASKKRPRRKLVDHLPIILGPILLEGDDARMATLIASRQEGKETISWLLNVDQRPKAKPPAFVLNLAKKIGREEIFQKFTTAVVPNDSVGTYSFHFHLSGKLWRCKLLPGEPSPTQSAVLSALANDPVLEEVGFRFKDADRKIDEISVTYRHESDAFLADVIVRGPVELTRGGWLPYAGVVLDFLSPVLYRSA